MSGRLIILPHKTWNVWRRDNVERVRRDERLHAEEEASKGEQKTQQSRAERLRLLRGQAEVTETQSPEESLGASAPPEEATDVGGRRKRSRPREDHLGNRADAKPTASRREQRREERPETFSLFSEEEAMASKRLAEATKAKQEMEKKEKEDLKRGFELGGLSKGNLWYLDKPKAAAAGGAVATRPRDQGTASARRHKRPKFKEDRDDEEWLRRWREEEESMGFGSDYLPDNARQSPLTRTAPEEDSDNGSKKTKRKKEKKAKKDRKERKREKKEKKKRKSSEREYIIVN